MKVSNVKVKTLFLPKTSKEAAKTIKEEMNKHANSPYIGYKLSDGSKILREPDDRVEISSKMGKESKNSRVMFNFNTGKVEDFVEVSRKKVVEFVEQFAKNLKNDQGKTKLEPEKTKIMAD